MAKKNLFIVGLDDFNREKLQRLPQASEVDFHPALEVSDMRGVDRFDMPGLIARAIDNMESAGVRIDGVASYWDFPGTVMVPILAQHFGLPGATLEAVLRCENKYWSRLVQQKVVPDHIPQFRAFDPFDDDAYAKLDLMPPFWIKPIKSFRSFLAFQVNGQRQFAEVMPICREKIGFLSEPFHYLMQHYEMPAEIAQMPESFIAESPIGGAQCTMEGYVHDGTVTIYGVIDSVREPDSSSFARYEYPSSLPLEIQHRMMDVTRAAVTQIGLNHCPFNIEFFYDQTADQVWLLEINPRVSQSHADVFEKVHGVSHQAVMVDLALGRKPKPMEKKGEFTVAANFMLRTYERGRITRIPSREAIDKLLARQPGTSVKISVQPGQHLSELQGQDMYTFELANIFIGGRDRSDLLDKYDLALTALQFDIDKDERPVIL